MVFATLIESQVTEITQPFLGQPLRDVRKLSRAGPVSFATPVPPARCGQEIEGDDLTALRRLKAFDLIGLFHLESRR